MQIIPLQDVPSQTLSATLGGQACTINVYFKGAYGTFFDLFVSDVLIVGGVVCQNLNRLVRSDYLKFIGDFCFLDQQGGDDPTTPGLGSRFVLVYLEASDVVAVR